MKFKILIWASLFFVQNLFSMDLPLAEIQVIGTSQQRLQMMSLVGDALMRSESVITIKMRNMVGAGEDDAFIMVNFHHAGHLRVLAEMVPLVSKGKVVFIYNPEASNDYRDAIRSYDGSVLTYGEFFHITSATPIEISGNINAPGAFLQWSSPPTVLTGGHLRCCSHWYGECNLEGSVREFLTMRPMMTPTNVADLRQYLEGALAERNLDREAQVLASMSLEEPDYPSIEKVLHGVIVGEGLSAVPFDPVHVEGSAVRVSSTMDGLIALHEQFPYLYATRNLIDVVLDMYEGVYYGDRKNVRIGKGWLIKSDGNIAVIDMASKYSSGYDWFFESGHDICFNGKIPEYTPIIINAEVVKMDETVDDPALSLLIHEVLGNQTPLLRPDVRIIQGRAPR